MIFDTHSHYDDEAFDEDREQLLDSFRAKGVGTVVTVGANMVTSRAAVELAHTHEDILCAIGVHPNEVAELTETDINWLREQAADSKVVAIGEVGLDYYWDEPEHDVQKYWFERQIELAREVELPIIYHSRDAAEDTMNIICEKKAYDIGGVIHCYSYSKEMASEYIEMGFFIGVGGVVTFKNGRKLKQTVEAIPMERIVLETDCPYLSPEPNRGKRNDSTNLIYVADEIARIKGLTREEVIDITEKNAKRLYRI